MSEYKHYDKIKDIISKSNGYDNLHRIILKERYDKMVKAGFKHDLNALKKPDTKKFQRRNEIRPFEDASSIEFLRPRSISIRILKPKRDSRLEDVGVYVF